MTLFKTRVVDGRHLLTSGAAGEWDETAGGLPDVSSGSLTLFLGTGVGCCHDGAKVKPRNNGVEKPCSGEALAKISQAAWEPSPEI
jgi:hypothetical protein